MDIKPIGSKIIVRPLSVEETTKSGIVLPESSQEKPQEGEVLAIGAGKFLDSGEQEKAPVSVGDIVMYTKYGPTEIKVEGEDLLILEFSDILAVRSGQRSIFPPKIKN